MSVKRMIGILLLAGFVAGVWWILSLSVGRRAALGLVMAAAGCAILIALAVSWITEG